MPTNRTKRTRQFKPLTIAESLKYYFSTGQYGADVCPDCPEIGETFMLAHPGRREEQRKIWLEHREGLLDEFIRLHPGSRPWAFWQFDAPELRQQIGGKGETEWEKYPAIVPYYTRGIPASWTWIDENDPPRYESEAKFLQRNGLLTPAEKAFLAKHPELLQPEKVEYEDDKDD